MNASYVQLNKAWQDAMRASGELDPLNRWLVVREVAISAARAESVLTTHGGDSEAREDAHRYAAQVEEQDSLSRTFSYGKELLELVGVTVVVSTIVGAVAGLAKALDDAQTAGQAFDWGRVAAALAGQGAIVFILVRIVAQAAGPIGASLSEAWNDITQSAQPARDIVARTITGPERAFFADLGARPPWHWMVHAVGPAFALLILAAVGIPLLLLAFYLYGSLAVTPVTPQNPGPFSPFGGG